MKRIIESIISAFRRHPVIFAGSLLLVIAIFIMVSGSRGLPVLKYKGVSFEIGDKISKSFLQKHYDYVWKGGSYYNLDGKGYSHGNVSIGVETNESGSGYVVDSWYVEKGNASVDGISLGDSARKVKRTYAKYNIDGDENDNEYCIEVWFDGNGKLVDEQTIDLWHQDGVRHYVLSFEIEDGEVCEISFMQIGRT